jgi:hypothetical protein
MQEIPQILILFGLYAAVSAPSSRGRVNLGQSRRRHDGEGRIWRLTAGRIRPDSAALPCVLTFIVPYR